MPLTEDLVPADSSQSYDIYPDANKPALSAIREVLDYRAWRTRRLEKSQLIAKRQRVVKQLSERDAYLSRLFR